MNRISIPLVLIAVFASVSWADEPVQTKMAERGKLAFSDDFSKTFAKDWKIGKGKWEIVDGALKGSEVKTDEHAATFRRVTPVPKAIIQYSFKLDGGKTTLSINSTKGHLSRVLINPMSIVTRKDSSDKNKADKTEVLDTSKVDLKKGTWYTLVLEQVGKEMVTQLDGKVVGYGEKEGLEIGIANIGFTVSGESVSFKNLQIWEANGVRAEWASEKSKIREKKK